MRNSAITIIFKTSDFAASHKPQITIYLQLFLTLTFTFNPFVINSSMIESRMTECSENDFLVNFYGESKMVS